MKQLSLFENHSSDTKSSGYAPATWTIYTDGASRRNPGPSGIGVVIYKNDAEFATYGYFIGNKTNNQAEYLALLFALFIIEQYKRPRDTLRLVADSELLVKQLNGIYKVKNAELRPLHALATKLLISLRATICHVMREDNVRADQLANEGVDKKREMPQQFIDLLTAHAITI